MTITKLDLPTKVDGLINADGDNIAAQLKKETDEKKTTPELSKKIATILIAIRKEITTQGTTFKNETEGAVKRCLQIHEMTKSTYLECAKLIEGLKKKWDAGSADVVAKKAQAADEASKLAHELKSEMKNHQAFRNGYCTATRAKQVLGERNYNELNKLYLGFREEPLKAYMALGDKWDKIDEHAKRAKNFVEMLPALSKEGGQGTEIEKAIEQDAAAIKQLAKDFKEGVEAKTKKVTEIINYIKSNKAKIDEKYLKTSGDILNGHATEIKGHRSKLKTAQLTLDNLPKKGAPIAKLDSYKTYAKEIKESVAAMEKLVNAWVKEHEKAMKEHGSLAKSLAKKN